MHATRSPHNERRNKRKKGITKLKGQVQVEGGRMNEVQVLQEPKRRSTLR